MNGVRRLFAAALLVSTASQGQAGEVNKIRDVGPDDNRLVLVIVGDGYRAAEQALFDTHAEQALAGLLAVTPYREYASMVNCYTDFVASNESGADKPAECFGGDTFRDTAFDATYCSRGIRRLLTVDNGAVFSMTNADVPSRDLVAVIVNDSEYGGAGGALLTFSVNPGAMEELFLHEAGHTFARLADEYEGDPGVGGSAPERNVTTETDIAAIDWSEWIDAGTPLPTPPGSPEVGAFEGGRYFSQGIYRPIDNCKMRSLNRPFGAVCTEAHIQHYHNLVSLIDTVTPANPSVLAGPCDDPLAFEVDGPRPTPDTIAHTWTLDGEVLIGEERSVLSLDPSGLSAGPHVLTVDLQDTTPLVRDPYLTPMSAGFTWGIVIEPAPGGDPGEVSDLRVSREAGLGSRLSWSDQLGGAVGTHAIVSGSLGELHVDRGFTRSCALTELAAGADWLDETAEGAEAIYYLIEAIAVGCGDVRTSGGLGTSRPASEDRRLGLGWDGLESCPGR